MFVFTMNICFEKKDILLNLSLSHLLFVLHSLTLISLLLTRPYKYANFVMAIFIQKIFASGKVVESENATMVGLISRNKNTHMAPLLRNLI